MAFVEVIGPYAEKDAARGGGRARGFALNRRVTIMTTPFILAATLLAITAMVCFAATRAWRGWLELKRLEIAAAQMPVGAEATEDEDISVRIELAAVRERLRKLEALASVVEL